MVGGLACYGIGDAAVHIFTIPTIHHYTTETHEPGSCYLSQDVCVDMATKNTPMTGFGVFYSILTVYLATQGALWIAKALDNFRR